MATAFVVDQSGSIPPLAASEAQRFAEALAAGRTHDMDQAAFVHVAREAEIAARRFHPFSGRIVDNEGKVRQESGTMTDDLLNRMDYYVQGVQGQLPKK